MKSLLALQQHLFPQDMDHHGLETQSAETAEVFALHQAIKWALAHTGESLHPVTIFYDCAGAGDPAAGNATASAETKKIARATRALVHYAESHGVRIEFTHVHSHQGHALNEFADNIAKAGAIFTHCSGSLFQLHQDWYQIYNGTADWAWLMNLCPFTKTHHGFPPVIGNVLPFPHAKMPCMHTLASYLMPDKQEDPVQRHIALSLASYNIGAVAQHRYTNGVTAFAGKAFMLEEGFKKEQLLVVGLQECRSKEGGTLP